MNNCDGCNKTFTNEKQKKFHNNICIFKKAKDINNILHKIDIINIVSLSNMLLFYNNKFPIEKEILLSAIINRYTIDKENSIQINKIFNLLTNDNNTSYDYNNILEIISIITNINKTNVIQITDLYKNCIKNLLL